MMNKDHVLTSEAAFMAFTDIASKPLSFAIPGAIGIWLGCQLPDIDNKNSHIHHVVPFSFLFSYFGHRGFIHSIWALGIFGWLMIMLNSWLSNILVKPLDASPISSAEGLPMLHTFFICLIVGYGLHLVEDSFSKAGEIWFFPFFKHSYRHIRCHAPKKNRYKHSKNRRKSQTIYIRTNINTNAWYRYTSSWGPKGRKERFIGTCALIILIIATALYLAMLLGLVSISI